VESDPSVWCVWCVWLSRSGRFLISRAADDMIKDENMCAILENAGEYQTQVAKWSMDCRYHTWFMITPYLWTIPKQNDIKWKKQKQKRIEKEKEKLIKTKTLTDRDLSSKDVIDPSGRRTRNKFSRSMNVWRTRSTDTFGSLLRGRLSKQKWRMWWRKMSRRMVCSMGLHSKSSVVFGALGGVGCLTWIILGIEGSKWRSAQWSNSAS
jgi:hypothetical protein